MTFAPLDPILHSELRLAIVSILISVEEADFNYLKARTNATSGNISVQLDKLTVAGYVEVKKGFLGKRTRTVCRITPKGIAAFDEYVKALKTYFDLPSGETS